MKASVRLVRFATIGTLNYLITMLVIWIVMSYFSFKGKYIVANIMAYLIAQTHNFIWSKYWSFPSSNPQNSLWQQICLLYTSRNLAQASAPETAVCQDCHYRFIFSHDADSQKGVSCRKADQ